MNNYESELRKADLCIETFELWILGRQFPSSEDYWDGNWLDVLARCSGESSMVETGGSILHLSELQKFLNESKQMYNTLSGKAHLDCMEPNINLKIGMKNRGQCELVVSITPYHLYEKHSFIFDLDQTYLPPLISSLEFIINSYPLKGEVERR
jgi:L-fucose mutarotase/ribose pyranase (RbsD/FucU family)